MKIQRILHVNELGPADDLYFDSLDKDIEIDRWLIENETKRNVFYYFYEDRRLFDSKNRIVDIGGGYSTKTNDLLRNENYNVVDYFYHSSNREKILLSTLQEKYQSQIHREDWSSFNFAENDIVLANDIFPNVDQRLDEFLCLMINSKIAYLRILLTFYEPSRYYQVQRIDAQEVLTIEAFTHERLIATLSKYVDNSKLTKFSKYSDFPSMYKNNRHCFIVDFEF